MTQVSERGQVRPKALWPVLDKFVQKVPNKNFQFMAIYLAMLAQEWPKSLPRVAKELQNRGQVWPRVAQNGSE